MVLAEDKKVEDKHFGICFYSFVRMQTFHFFSSKILFQLLII